MAEPIPLPHRLTLTNRRDLSVTGVTEVVSFDDSTAVLNIKALNDRVARGNEMGGRLF